ncbi:MAG: hypothetical protein M3271_03065 [Actinomycetota bacterium]|nr:hypothetical protein [Actinomycetota bacterium]
MHPLILGQVARDHVHSLIEEADAVRLAHSIAGPRRPRGIRRRLGLGLIALGSRLAPGQPCNVVRIREGRV